MSIKAVFGANLKYYRKQKRFSQEQLAEKLDISSKHLSSIETGGTFVSAELLERITDYLNVSASALFYTAEEKSGDDSFLNEIDKIVEKEMVKAIETIKIEMRRIRNR